MKVEFILYKTFDADLISLGDNGISISAMAKLALRYRSRGKKVYFYIPKCIDYDISRRAGSVHVIVNVTDPKSISFLKKNIKRRQRSAFMRSIVRDSLVDQAVGVYLKNSAAIAAETGRIASKDISTYSDIVTIIPGQQKRRDYTHNIKRMTIGEEALSAAVDEPDSDEGGFMKFGDISDLAISIINNAENKNGKNDKGTANPKKKKRGSGKKNAPPAPVPDSVDDRQVTEPELNSDDDVFSQFVNL